MAKVCRRVGRFIFTRDNSITRPTATSSPICTSVFLSSAQKQPEPQWEEGGRDSAPTRLGRSQPLRELSSRAHTAGVRLLVPIRFDSGSKQRRARTRFTTRVTISRGASRLVSAGDVVASPGLSGSHAHAGSPPGRKPDSVRSGSRNPEHHSHTSTYPLGYVHMSHIRPRHLV